MKKVRRITFHCWDLSLWRGECHRVFVIFARLAKFLNCATCQSCSTTCEFSDQESLVPDEASVEDEKAPDTSGAATEDDSWVPFDEHEDSPLSGSQSGLASIDSEPESLEEAGGPSAVMLEESPLPRMFLPGKIVHIYTHRGGYKAAFVPRAFRELRRISLAGNMLSDHTCKAYYEALLEVRTVRSAPEGLPRWTAFDEDDTWYGNAADWLMNVLRFSLIC
jgi:hypothetical protein